jgi:L-lactate dehydrogenase
MKVGIIGAGAVGAASFLSIIMRGSAREVGLVNRNRKKAQGVVTDIRYGAVLSPPIDVRDGDYSDLVGASVVILTAGVNEKGGGATDRSDPVGRLRLLEANTAVFQEVVPKVHNVAPEALILVVTDPVWSKKSNGLKKRGLQPRLVSSDCLLHRLDKAYNSSFFPYGQKSQTLGSVLNLR